MESISLDFKDLISLNNDLRGDVWLLWSVHTTVVVAIIGWLMERRNNFDHTHKVIMSGAYSVFVTIILVSLYKTYNEFLLLSVDIEQYAKLLKPKPLSGGYINYIIKGNGFIDYRSLSNSLLRSFPIAIVCYIFVLYLIWSDKVWNLLSKKDTQSNKTN